MLDEQYLMDKNICKIISSHMYNNKLKTAADRSPAKNLLPEPFNRPLTIVDTSTIYPFCNKDLFKSRYNLMHTLAVRNLCLHLKGNRVLEDSSVGVCTPFAAQAKLSKKVLRGSGLDKVDAGTVHRYQGDEKSVMILDVPDSLGEHYAGIFLQADNPEDAGAKLFNVAVSRAEEHLIVFANLAFLDAKLPNHAILRDILAEMQDQGSVVDVRDVLSLWPVMEDLKRYGFAFDLSPDAEKTGLFNQKDFEVVCQADLARAKKSIVVFSGFITAQRVASYEALFRSKLAEGVKIRCVTRPPHRNGSVPKENSRAALDGLEKMGCVIDTRGNIHEKAVIIDGQTVWFGSLNPLSHTAKTAEVMARIEDSGIALQLISFMAIGKQKKSDDSSDLFTAKENPECPECKSRATYMTGRYGPYWDCEVCSWRENIGAGTGKPRGGSSMRLKGPACPKCGAFTVKRMSRFGEFFGCSAYPECRYTAKGAG
jgi:ribosomal protein L37AE/L43A